MAIPEEAQGSDEPVQEAHHVLWRAQHSQVLGQERDSSIRAGVKVHLSPKGYMGQAETSVFSALLASLVYSSGRVPRPDGGQQFPPPGSLETLKQQAGLTEDEG